MIILLSTLLNKEADLDDSKSAFFQLGKLLSLDKMMHNVVH